jgi:hypothetical protein
MPRYVVFYAKESSTPRSPVLARRALGRRIPTLEAMQKATTGGPIGETETARRSTGRLPPPTLASS